MTTKAWVTGVTALVTVAATAGTDASGNATVYVHGWYGQAAVYVDDVAVT
jgi:hypothetical protein